MVEKGQDKICEGIQKFNAYLQWMVLLTNKGKIKCKMLSPVRSDYTLNSFCYDTGSIIKHDRASLCQDFQN